MRFLIIDRIKSAYGENVCYWLLVLKVKPVKKLLGFIEINKITQLNMQWNSKGIIDVF